MDTEIKTIDELESFIISLEEELDKAVNSILNTLPIKIPRLIKIQGIYIQFIEVSATGEECNQYIPGRPGIELSVDINNGRRK